MPGRLETILRTLDKRRETSPSENPGAFAVLSRCTWLHIPRASTLVVSNAAFLHRFPQPFPVLVPWGALPQLEGEAALLSAPHLSSPVVTEGAQGSLDKPSRALLQRSSLVVPGLSRSTVRRAGNLPHM